VGAGGGVTGVIWGGHGSPVGQLGGGGITIGVAVGGIVGGINVGVLSGLEGGKEGGMTGD